MDQAGFTLICSWQIVCYKHCIMSISLLAEVESDRDFAFFAGFCLQLCLVAVSESYKKGIEH